MMHILSGIKGIKKICLTKTQNVVTPVANLINNLRS